ncbi:MAG: rhodanese-like domain-containing protein [Verrucomicrobiota bacterium]|nr:rhodanese-like domain-containing protein [Verrucomicrobiota bacterium]
MLLVVVAALLGAVTWAVHPRMPAYAAGRLEAGEILLASIPANALWVDARTLTEYKQEHVPGAILLNEDDWESLLAQFINTWKGQPVVVYCGSGECHASKAVVARLKEYMPDIEAYHLKDGWAAWKEHHP